MKCASALSTARNTDTAFDAVKKRLEEGLEGEAADLTVLFTSMHHADALGRMAKALLEQGRTRHVIGCTGESIVGEHLEVEGSAAIAGWSITLPEVEIQPLHLGDPAEPDMDQARSLEKPEQAVLILLGDPFSFRIDEFLQQVNREARGLRVVGGMASGSQVPRLNQFVLDGQTFIDGAVGVLLDGPISVKSVVSQGCRPIGRPMIVTRAENNVIHQLGRRPALEVLRETYEQLSAEDQKRLQDGLHLGRVINEYQDSFHRGDFLIRNVVGADDSGAIQVTDVVRVGQTVQFHLRDAETADEDLRESLKTERKSAPNQNSPAGALLFSCNGRGTRLFGEPNHDVGVIHEILGPVPTAGFFAMGEIGPIGGQNFVHGFTASIVLFQPPD